MAFNLFLCQFLHQRRPDGLPLQMCPIDLRSCQAFKKVRGLFRVKVLQVSIRAQMPADGAVHRHALGTTEIFAMLTPIRAAYTAAITHLTWGSGRRGESMDTLWKFDIAMKMT